MKVLKFGGTSVGSIKNIKSVKEIINEIKELGLKVHIHNSKKRIDPKTDIYLVNSFGQTKSFFKVCIFLKKHQF